MKIIYLLYLAFVSTLGGCARPAFAMDRFAALSMIESGDNDFAVGASGEVSRYQIMPAVWTNAAPLIPIRLAGHPMFAQMVACSIQFHRAFAFSQIQHRAPTDAEWYLLWHRPARVLHPTPREQERASRFANLCADFAQNPHNSKSSSVGAPRAKAGGSGQTGSPTRRVMVRTVNAGHPLEFLL